MLSRSTFISAIENIQAQEKKVEEFSAALAKMSDGVSVFDAGNQYLRGLLDVLKTAMNDRGDYIEWWLYEATDYHVSWEEEGKDVCVDLEDINALYDYLVQEAGEIPADKLPLHDLPDRPGSPYPHKAMELSDFSVCMDSVLAYLDRQDVVIQLQQDGQSKYVIMSVKCYNEMFGDLDQIAKGGKQNGCE